MAKKVNVVSEQHRALGGLYVDQQLISCWLFLVLSWCFSGVLFVCFVLYCWKYEYAGFEKVIGIIIPNGNELEDDFDGLSDVDKMEIFQNQERYFNSDLLPGKLDHLDVKITPNDPGNVSTY